MACSRTPSEWVSEKAQPPSLHAAGLRPSPTPGLKSLQPHLRPIVLAENLGQGHGGGEGIISASAPLNTSRLQPRQVTREPAGPPRPGAGPGPAGEVDGRAAAGVVGRRARREDGSCPNYSGSPGSNLV